MVPNNAVPAKRVLCRVFQNNAGFHEHPQQTDIANMTNMTFLHFVLGGHVPCTY